MSDFLFVPLRPFFYAALTKRWKVLFHMGLRKFNNVDSKTTYFNENCCIILYIYILLDVADYLSKYFGRNVSCPWHEKFEPAVYTLLQVVCLTALRTLLKCTPPSATQGKAPSC